MRFLTIAAVAVLALAGAGAWVVEDEPGWYLRTRYPLEYDNVLRGPPANHHLDPALLAAVVYVESHFDPNAESAAGAIGLMQLLPDTAKGIALRTGGFSPEELEEAGAVAVFESLDDLIGSLDETPLAP